MIGRWLELLTEQEEDNLLTTKLIPFTSHFVENPEKESNMGCLVGAALKHLGWNGQHTGRYGLWSWWNEQHLEWNRDRNIAYRFNELCQKLAGIPVRKRIPCGGFTCLPFELEGGARVAVLIRARIWRNRARRLKQQEVPNAEATYSH